MQNFRELRNTWISKLQLRLVYEKWYKTATKFLEKGKTLEVGCGIGNFKEYYNCIGIDITHTGFEDIHADARYLPFKSNIFNNVICFDLVHHIES